MFAPTEFESTYVTSCWSSIVTLVLSCRVSEILELCTPKATFTVPHPYSGQNFGSSLWSISMMLGLQRSN